MLMSSKLIDLLESEVANIPIMRSPAVVGPPSILVAVVWALVVSSGHVKAWLVSLVVTGVRIADKRIAYLVLSFKMACF